jgi:hypothetical protein
MKNKDTQVFLFGGLGNQLFQYYFGLYLVKSEGKSVTFDESISKKFGNNHGTTLSSFLNIESRGSKSNLQSAISSFALRILIKVQDKVKIEKLLRTIRLYVATEVGFSYVHKPNTPLKRYFGYFQTWRYFDSVGGKSIFHENLQGPRSDQYLKYSELISSRKTIGIHVRSGDYLTLSDSYGLLASSYYDKALACLGLDEETQILLVSDDIDLAEGLLSGIAPKSNWINLRDTGPLESILLLGQCEKICISNSTFGYWAAMLGKAETVIAPDKWFRNLDDPKDLIPDNWLLQASEWQN